MNKTQQLVCSVVFTVLVVFITVIVITNKHSQQDGERVQKWRDEHITAQFEGRIVSFRRLPGIGRRVDYVEINMNNNRKQRFM